MSSLDTTWRLPTVVAVVAVWAVAGAVIVRWLGVLVGGAVTVWGGSTLVLVLVLWAEERAVRARAAPAHQAPAPAPGARPVAA